MSLILRFISRKEDRCPESTGHYLHLIMFQDKHRRVSLQMYFLICLCFQNWVSFFAFKMHILYKGLYLREKESQEKHMSEFACCSENTVGKGAFSLAKPLRTSGENICIEN